MISESTNRAGMTQYDWQGRSLDRATAAFHRMMHDADAHQLARGRHQFTSDTRHPWLEERENGNV